MNTPRYATRTLRLDPNKLRAARENAHLTQEQMGKVLGVRKAQISKIESGQHSLNAENLASWCEACGIEHPFNLYTAQPKTGLS